jgi:DNA-binding NarL/FixJ family response regulator
MTLRALIAEDHGAVRKGLRLLIEQHTERVVVGEAANGERRSI